MSESLHLPGEYAGTKGLILFGGALVLAYVRDDNTESFPGFLDLPGGGREEGETPFQTYQREVKEEFGLDIEPQDVIFHTSYPSMLDPSIAGHFIVARQSLGSIRQIEFGNEGKSYQIMALNSLLDDERLIPFLKGKVEFFWNQMAKELPAAQFTGVE